ncbi:MAG: protein-L-isoaspartate(D-aspartate) O-methyltransferase [Elusimicrobiota bacterium]|nr:protein-L-isoaspartate(D-aspartate) O-methyltransferase [Elusimicrobiota bacterium]
MDDFEKLRRQMVETQIVTRGISDKKIIDAMLKIPREQFIEKKFYNEAYNDHPLPIEEGQTISQPYIVALMTELLQLTNIEKVLEIGTGSGYQTAILAELSKKVYTVERLPTLFYKAKNILKDLGYKNVFLFNLDGTEGLKEHSPFDRIIVTAASDKIPQPLVEQLNESGRLIIPIGDRFSQELLAAEKINGKLEIKNYGGVTFVPLIGKYGVDE